MTTSFVFTSDRNILSQYRAQIYFILETTRSQLQCTQLCLLTEDQLIFGCQTFCRPPGILGGGGDTRDQMPVLQGLQQGTCRWFSPTQPTPGATTSSVDCVACPSCIWNPHQADKAHSSSSLYKFPLVWILVHFRHWEVVCEGDGVPVCLTLNGLLFTCYFQLSLFSLVNVLVSKFLWYRELYISLFIYVCCSHDAPGTDQSMSFCHSVRLFLSSLFERDLLTITPMFPPIKVSSTLMYPVLEVSLASDAVTIHNNKSIINQG